MYVMNNSRKVFDGQLTEWLREEGFIQYQFQMSIYYKYVLDGTKIVVLSYVEDCVQILENGLWMLYERDPM